MDDEKEEAEIMVSQKELLRSCTMDALRHDVRKLAEENDTLKADLDVAVKALKKVKDLAIFEWSQGIAIRALAKIKSPSNLAPQSPPTE